MGYVPYKGIFIAAADHAQKQYDSVIASAFAKQGVTYNGDQAKRNKESPEQIRAAIKELFPKIPQHDLDEVVAHAWDKKTTRVGRAKDLTLPQRAQYAVVARIRHKYTDYDTLLAAKWADWKTCRKEVEPFTLEKVIEWRGETDDDDEGLEEIVRETIVINDDDDDDDDAPIVINSDDSSDTGYASDTSIEISSRPAAAEDLRAEEASERDHAFFRRRNSGRMHQRTDLARQMIHRHRNKEHNDRAYAYNQAARYQHPPAGSVQRTYGASLSTVASPGQIIVGGQVMRLVSCPFLLWRFDRLILDCTSLLTLSHTHIHQASICNTIDPCSQLSVETIHTYNHRHLGHHRYPRYHRHPGYHRQHGALQTYHHRHQAHTRSHPHYRHLVHHRKPGTLTLRHKLHVWRNQTIMALASSKTSLGMLSLRMHFHLINTTEDKLIPKRNSVGMALNLHHRHAACTMSDF